MFAHLAEAEPILYVRLLAGRRSPEIVVVPRVVVPADNVPPKMALPLP